MHIENWKKLTTLSGICTLQLHYHKMGWLTHKLWTTCSIIPHWVHKYVITLALSCVLVAL